MARVRGRGAEADSAARSEPATRGLGVARFGLGGAVNGVMPTGEKGTPAPDSPACRLPATGLP